MIFPYVRYQVEGSSAIPSGEVSRPEVPIRIIGPKAVVEADGLVDTGADQVFVPMSLAEVLGIELGNDHMEGAKAAGGHELKVWPGEIEFEIADDQQSYRWRVQVGCIESEDDIASVYLGHVGFLEHFRAIFDCDLQTVDLIASQKTKALFTSRN